MTGRERDAFYDAQAWVSVCGERDALTGWREGQGEERERDSNWIDGRRVRMFGSSSRVE